ncbi:hypothetical protein NPIL_262701 [Nephila pilipes]|uniref:Uncharacterized protein n=1 Tax=Nephila pilipes TaxID=299642 RepID=A0A8X6TSN9_NEPPI|nr:hypothetical protein NPIL_262701 [Nephila pilipes]
MEMEYMSAYHFLGPMYRLQTDGTIVGRFKKGVGSVVSVQGIQDRLSQFDPRGHRLASMGVSGRKGQQVQFWVTVLCPNGLQHRSMPPLCHLVQDTLAERKGVYNFRGIQAVQMLQKLHKKSINSVRLGCR